MTRDVKRSIFAASLLVSIAPVACGNSTPPPATPATPLRAAAMTPVAAERSTEDPAPVTDGNVTVGWLRGMQIVVWRTPGAEFVGARLAIRGGTRNWTAANAGVENLALQVATRGGTKSLTKDQFANKLASLGAWIDGNCDNDFSSIGANAPREVWDALFPMMVETFLAPALPQTEFDVQKQRDLSALKHELETGDGRLWHTERKQVFANHPYANRPNGTIETLSSIQLADLGPHLEKLRDTNRLLLVVVGDVDAAQVIDQAKTAFASVPRGSYIETPIPALHYDGAHVVGDTFKLPTSYIQSSFAGPQWGDPDFVPMWLAMDALGHRVWDEVRSKRNLSYAPLAYDQYRLAAPISVLYVTAVDPTTTMGVMFDEVRRLQNEPVPAKELAAIKSVFLSRYLVNQETTDWRVWAVVQAVILGGDWHLIDTFPDRVRAVRAEDIQRVAKKWLVNPQTAIVGDPGKLDPKAVGVSAVGK